LTLQNDVEELQFRRDQGGTLMDNSSIFDMRIPAPVALFPEKTRAGDYSWLDTVLFHNNPSAMVPRPIEFCFRFSAYCLPR
jgi:hypothetical protein